VVITAAYLVALNAVRQSPEELRQRFAVAAAASPTGAVGPGDAFEIVFGRMLPIMLIFVYCCSWRRTVRGCRVLPRAAPRRRSAGLRRRCPALRRAEGAAFVGWTVLGGLVLTLVIAVPVLPGIFTQIGPLVAVVRWSPSPSVCWSG